MLIIQIHLVCHDDDGKILPTESEKRKENLVANSASQSHNLKHERQLRGWSQADIATRIGSDPKTVARWERGLTSPCPYYRQKLIDLFGKNAEVLGFVRA